MKKKQHVENSGIRGNEESLLKIPLRREFLIEHIGSKKDVLDAGCCTGYFSLLLAEAGNNVTGLELNPEAAKKARERGVKIIEHDLEEDFPFEKETFDAVVGFEIIEHLYDPQHFLSESNRVLRPGGFILISTPNLNSLYQRLQVLFGFHIHFLGTYPEDSHGDHIRIFNKKTLKDLLIEAGFKPTVWYGISYLPPPLHYIFKLLPTLADLLLVRADKVTS